jgi:antibiotic biosynthesis monooxygenase (ABM) superfamily enzyme
VGCGVSGPAIEPVSTLISRSVPAAKVAQFEALLHELIVVARGFEGHLGADVLRPESGGVYQIIFRYRGPAEQEAWMRSDERRRLVARIDELLDDQTTAQVRSIDGWEGWFVSPDYAPPVPPRRWKTALITFGALYPIVLGLTIALTALTGGIPVPLAMLVTMGLTIPLMTWVVMPALTTRLGPWLRR